MGAMSGVRDEMREICFGFIGGVFSVPSCKVRADETLAVSGTVDEVRTRRMLYDGSDGSSSGNELT
jgi:hypothetical protein